jgi:hypothetical protein
MVPELVNAVGAWTKENGHTRASAVWHFVEIGLKLKK